MNMLQAIQSKINQPETPAKGFRTCAQWATLWNMSENHARKLLGIGVQQKITVMRAFKRPTGVGVRKVPHYGPAGK